MDTDILRFGIDDPDYSDSPVQVLRHSWRNRLSAVVRRRHFDDKGRSGFCDFLVHFLPAAQFRKPRNWLGALASKIDFRARFPGSLDPIWDWVKRPPGEAFKRDFWLFFLFRKVNFFDFIFRVQIWLDFVQCKNCLKSRVRGLAIKFCLFLGFFSVKEIFFLEDLGFRFKSR